MDMGYTVKNVILNYYAPLSCALDGECFIPWGYWSSNKCHGYIAGCPPGDSHLTFDKWQKAWIGLEVSPLMCLYTTVKGGYMNIYVTVTTVN